MRKFFNPSKQKPIRQTLRKEMPRAEKILWSCLRKRFLTGFKFRRQHGLGPYIMDFYCPRAKLAIEIDGDSHYQPGAQPKDKARQKFIENQGIMVLRFTNYEIRDSLDEVVGIIERHCRSIPTPSNSPLERGRVIPTPSNSPLERGRVKSSPFPP